MLFLLFGFHFYQSIVVDKWCFVWGFTRRIHMETETHLGVSLQQIRAGR